ncbi:MAG: TolC family protein [Bacteroidales bacterium]|nr:TolC family protein [Bacteroidales bacterium]
MRNLFKKCVVSALASAVTVFASGQTTDDRLPECSEGSVMTLNDCMKYAVSNSTKIRIQQAAIGDAQIDRRDAALKLFTPQINAQTYAYYNFGRSIDPQTNTYFNTTSFHNNYGISAGYDLFDGFQAVNNWKISKTGMLIADSQEKQVEADICLAVMEAYYNVVYYKRLCEVYEEQVATAERALTKAKRQEELGQRGHADMIEMEADLADRQYDLTNTYHMYLDQKMTLADLMFWPVDEELQIICDLRFFADAQDDNINPSVNLSDSSVILGDSEESIVNYALEHNPGIQIASWQQLNAMRELNTAKWQLLPTLGLYAGWSTSYYTYQGSETATFANQFKNNGGEYVELSLQIPIWNHLSSHSRISRKRNALDKATAELDQKRRDVESEVRRAIQDRDGAATAYQQAQRKAEVQAEAYTLNLKKLEQGLISPLEFQTANNNFLKAQADEMNSLFKYIIKQAVVRYYYGVDYINQ